MLEIFNKKVKRGIGILSIACFLSTPVSYTLSMSSAAAAPNGQPPRYEEPKNPPPNANKNDKNHRNDKDRPPSSAKNDRNNDKNRPAPPPPNDRNDKDWNKDHSKDKNPPPPPPKKDKDDDDDKGYSKGNITTAVLVGGVIGAIIAKNT